MKIVRKTVVMDSVQIRRTIMRIAHEIVERNKEVKELILVGIRKRGVPIAERIAHFIEDFEQVSVPVGVLDITLYRDDLQMVDQYPVVGKTEINEDINDRIVILVDDVLFTGRTVRAALDVAMESEVKAYDFYDGALVEVTDAEVRELFLELRDEEANHQKLIQQIIAKMPKDDGFDPDDFVDEPAAQ